MNKLSVFEKFILWLGFAKVHRVANKDTNLKGYTYGNWKKCWWCKKPYLYDDDYLWRRGGIYNERACRNHQHVGDVDGF